MVKLMMALGFVAGLVAAVRFNATHGRVDR